MHSHQRNTVCIQAVPISKLLSELFSIFPHMILPRIHCFVGGSALLKLICNLQQILCLHSPVLSVFPKIVVVAYCLADIIHRCHRGHSADHLQVILQLLNPLHHPASVLIPGFQAVPGNNLSLQGFPADKSFRTVDDPQHICSFRLSVLCQFITCYADISQDILGNPVLIQVGKRILHPEGKIPFHHPLH